MNRITAEEARKLVGPSVQDHVDAVYLLIRKAAAEKRRSVHLSGEDIWTRGGYSTTPEWEEACAILRADGYTVTFFCEERQFVDMYKVVNMYTVVKW